MKQKINDNKYMSAEEQQKMFEELCALPEEELKRLWEGSEAYDKLKKFYNRISTRWITKGNIVTCSRCGFGYDQTNRWYQDGVQVNYDDLGHGAKYCPGCGARIYF